MRENSTGSALPYVVVFLTLAAAANLAIARWGPGAAVLVALLLVGPDLTVRDRLHDLLGRWRWPGMAALIAAGAPVSYVVNRDAATIAVASCAAFGAAGIADALLYARLRSRPWLQRANGSNVAGAAVDSLVFPLVAFGAVLPGVTAGQFFAKLAGGLLWSLALARRR